MSASAQVGQKWFVFARPGWLGPSDGLSKTIEESPCAGLGFQVHAGSRSGFEVRIGSNLNQVAAIEQSAGDELFVA